MMTYTPTTPRFDDDDWTDSSATTSTTYRSYRRTGDSTRGFSVIDLYPDSLTIFDNAVTPSGLTEYEMEAWIQLYIHRWNRVYWRALRKDIKGILFHGQVILKPILMYFRLLFSKSGYLPARIKQKKKG